MRASVLGGVPDRRHGGTCAASVNEHRIGLREGHGQQVVVADASDPRPMESSMQDLNLNAHAHARASVVARRNGRQVSASASQSTVVLAMAYGLPREPASVSQRYTGRRERPHGCTPAACADVGWAASGRALFIIAASLSTQAKFFPLRLGCK